MNKFIEDGYVSYEVALLLKEKEFDIPTHTFYNPKKSCFLLKLDPCLINRNAGVQISAPSHQMVMKWLREIHKIDIDIISRLSLNADNDHNYSYVIKHQYDKYHYNTYTDGEYQYFEEAVEEAINIV